MKTKYVNGRVYNYDYCLGGIGIGGRNFFFPVDFALGSNGSLYVLSKGCEFVTCHGISKVTLDHELLWEDRGNQSAIGFMDGQAPVPSSIAVDSQENVYVADEMTNHIYIFDSDGKRIGNWGSGVLGGLTTPQRTSNDFQTDVPGLMPIANNFSIPFEQYLKKIGAVDSSGDGELNGPNGLIFDEDDKLFISDSNNHRIQMFTKDGQFISKWGKHGSDDGELNLPWGLTLDRDHNVYVADWGNSRVQKFSDDGRHLATFGAGGSGEGELDHPSSVAVDKDGDVYVTDWGGHRLVVYDSEGEFLTTFHGDADQITPWAQEKLVGNPGFQRARKRADLSREKNFRRPVAVKVDEEGRIMVLEAIACRLQIYVKEQDWSEPPFNL